MEARRTNDLSTTQKGICKMPAHYRMSDTNRRVHLMTDTQASPPIAPLTWPTPAREAAFAAWLGALGPTQGLLPETLRPASADASFRRYFRVDRAAAVGGGS
ncbi:MAG: hypothetical protein RLZZ612_1914, partial [Pseudomonadota bacterium]